MTSVSSWLRMDQRSSEQGPLEKYWARILRWKGENAANDSCFLFLLPPLPRLSVYSRPVALGVVRGSRLRPPTLDELKSLGKRSTRYQVRELTSLRNLAMIGFERWASLLFPNSPTVNDEIETNTSMAMIRYDSSCFRYTSWDVRYPDALITIFIDYHADLSELQIRGT